ncbi:MAG: DUF1573 domain-containing protein [Desulfobacteraceae bacterium]|nr:DUF1573 domain-containing protein [Desulfobacteraceae bacterium]
MKKWLFLLMLVLLWIQPLYADTSSSTATRGTPSGSITDPSYKFDPVIEGDVVTHEFTLSNTGTAPLEILKVQSG